MHYVYVWKLYGMWGTNRDGKYAHNVFDSIRSNVFIFYMTNKYRLRFKPYNPSRVCMSMFFSFFSTECLCAKAILNFPISVSRPSKQSVYWFLHFVWKKTPIVSKEINSFVVFVSGQCGRYCVEYRLHALRNLYSMVRCWEKKQKRKKANV